jgi:hypothetical protein
MSPSSSLGTGQGSWGSGENCTGPGTESSLNQMMEVLSGSVSQQQGQGREGKKEKLEEGAQEGGPAGERGRPLPSYES